MNEKLRLVHSFPMTYHLFHSDVPLKINCENTVRPFFDCVRIFVFLKLRKNGAEFGKTLKTKKLRNFIIYPTTYYLPILDKGFENRSKSSFSGHIEAFSYF